MIEQLDLLGEPVMQRGAEFVGDNRIVLGRKWALGPRACVIGHNPSNAGGAALFNGQQLINDMETLKNLLLKCAEEALSKKS